MVTIANVTVGKADTKPDKPSHIRGVREGNAPKALMHDHSAEKTDSWSIGEAPLRRSTGINPEQREPIDPDMPRLSPA